MARATNSWPLTSHAHKVGLMKTYRRHASISWINVIAAYPYAATRATHSLILSIVESILPCFMALSSFIELVRGKNHSLRFRLHSKHDAECDRLHAQKNSLPSDFASSLST